MNASKLSSALYCAVAISLLSGCAASVKSGGSPMLPIQATAKQNLRVNFEGNSKVQQNEAAPDLAPSTTFGGPPPPSLRDKGGSRMAYPASASSRPAPASASQRPRAPASSGI